MEPRRASNVVTSPGVVAGQPSPRWTESFSRIAITPGSRSAGHSPPAATPVVVTSSGANGPTPLLPPGRCARSSPWAHSSLPASCSPEAAGAPKSPGAPGNPATPKPRGALEAPGAPGALRSRRPTSPASGSENVTRRPGRATEPTTPVPPARLAPAAAIPLIRPADPPFGDHTGRACLGQPTPAAGVPLARSVLPTPFGSGQPRPCPVAAIRHVTSSAQWAAAGNLSQAA